MIRLTRYIEEIPLGLIFDDHTERRTLLTEKVTVCPSCRNLRTLRREEGAIRCATCEWQTDAAEAHAA